MTDIVVTEEIHPIAIELLSARYDVLYEPDLVDRPADLHKAIADCRGLVVTYRTQVNDALLDHAPHVEVIGRAGAGMDNIDQDACARRDIPVFPASGANAVAVAEFCLAAILLLHRPNVFTRSDDVLAGKWREGVPLGLELGGRKLGIVGFGHIGKALAKRAAALGMQVSACNRRGKPEGPEWAEYGVSYAGFPTLLAESDVLCIVAPVTPETRNLIDADALKAMKPGAGLINAGRGGIVDEAALAAGLHAGEIAGAVIDVWDVEPLPDGTPLKGAPNLIAVPHMGGVSHEGRQRIGEMTAARVLEVLDRNQRRG
jgi:(S)-sulfolactate dehydrogenase